MRSRGRRIPGNESQLRESVAGHLYFGPTPLDDFGPRMQARLVDQQGEDVILPLHYAKILRVDGVMHICGIEYYLRGRKGSPERWKQSWLCTRKPEDALAILDKVRVPTVTGFTDDDMIEDELPANYT